METWEGRVGEVSLSLYPKWLKPLGGRVAVGSSFLSPTLSGLNPISLILVLEGIMCRIGSICSIILWSKVYYFFYRIVYSFFFSVLRVLIFFFFSKMLIVKFKKLKKKGCFKAVLNQCLKFVFLFF